MLIRTMNRENPLWGAPRIHGELLKLGIRVSQASVSKYMVKSHRPPSQTWRTFLANHSKDIVAIDFFTVPTVTFQILYVYITLSHHSRQVLHFNVTAHPTAAWTAQQIVEAFPWDSAPRYLLRDRDCIYGQVFSRRVTSHGIKEVITAPRSPWQNAYVERVIGSIRRECLDHVIVLNERHLKRVLKEYIRYYHESRTHLGLEKDTPMMRETDLPENGKVIAFPRVGGLHHHYERHTA